MSTGVGMSSCCISGFVHDGTPKGREDTIGGISTYIAEPADGKKTKTVVFLVDIFGWKFPNTRLLADNYAKAGFYVYVPDVHEGDSLDIEFLQSAEPPLKTREQMTLVDKTKATADVATTLGPWLVKHREAVAEPIISGFINTVKMIPGTNKVGEKLLATVNHHVTGETILTALIFLGCVGFCWGGRYAILQAHDRKEGEVGGVDAAVACHPSLVTVPGDFQDVNKPLSIAHGDKDSLLDNNTVDQFTKLLKEKDVPTEVKIYEDQVHGFALRSDWSSDKDKKAMDDAEKQGIAWFNKYLS